MKAILILFVFIVFFVTCTNDKVCGDWYFKDGRKISIKDEYIIFNDDSKDLLEYKKEGLKYVLLPKAGELFSHKEWIIDVVKNTSDSLIVYDNLLEKTYIFSKYPPL